MTTNHPQLSTPSLFDPAGLPKHARLMNIAWGSFWFSATVALILLMILFPPERGSYFILAWGPLCCALIRLIPLLIRK